MVPDNHWVSQVLVAPLCGPCLAIEENIANIANMENGESGDQSHSIVPEFPSPSR
jgi:hypothetical protein